MVRLTFTDNGPILLEADGPFTIRRDGRSQEVESVRIALCRCGHSGSQPYCDGTHRRAGFAAPPGELAVEPRAG